MRFHADSAFHIGSQHLRGGMPCQDYALAGGDADHTFAIVTDGCSTGGRTDVGARIVAHTTAQALRGPDITGAGFDHGCFEHDTLVADAMGLSVRDLLATCLYIKALPHLHGIQARILGDGVIAHRNPALGGGIWMERLDWAKNMPAYRAYHDDGFDSFIAALADEPAALTITDHYRSGGDIRNNWHSMSRNAWQGVKGREFYFNSEDTAFIGEIAVFSDGVTQVDGMDWRDVVAQLMSFKSTEGDFVKRRMNRFLKDCRQYGKGPIDDIAMACIHVEHGESV